jgi:hypothetical protein
MPDQSLGPILNNFLPVFLLDPFNLHAVMVPSFCRARPVNRGASLGLFTDKNLLKVDLELALGDFLSDAPRCLGEFKDWLV